ncbi:MAG TPA: hypothetical protein VLA89_02895 [Gemmatimonadales bacterium]|nr:hypothetical protein [Gemmatimonadales bacterium]
MAQDLGDNVVAYVECRRDSLPGLAQMAERVDRFVGVDPLPKYSLSEAFSAILNGGSSEEIQAAMSMVTGWSFRPMDGWARE